MRLSNLRLNIWIKAHICCRPCGSEAALLAVNMVPARIRQSDDLPYIVQELRLVQKSDKQGKNVMWCFVEFDEIVQAARCMKVLQVSKHTNMRYHHSDVHALACSLPSQCCSTLLVVLFL